MEGIEKKSRLRQIDWKKVLEIADANPGETMYLGIVDQSMRTHIRKGRFAYIDPSKYEVWTFHAKGEKRTRAHLFLKRVA